MKITNGFRKLIFRQWDEGNYLTTWRRTCCSTAESRSLPSMTGARHLTITAHLGRDDLIVHPWSRLLAGWPRNCPRRAGRTEGGRFSTGGQDRSSAQSLTMATSAKKGLEIIGREGIWRDAYQAGVVKEHQSRCDQCALPRGRWRARHAI